MQLDIGGRPWLKETAAHSKERLSTELRKKTGPRCEGRIPSPASAFWQSEKHAIGKIRELKDVSNQLKAEEQMVRTQWRAGEGLAEIRTARFDAAEAELKKRRNIRRDCKKKRRDAERRAWDEGKSRTLV